MPVELSHEGRKGKEEEKKVWGMFGAEFPLSPWA